MTEAGRGDSRPSSRDGGSEDSDWLRRSVRSRAGFGTVLVLAMGMAPLIQYAVAALAPLLVADLDISRTQIGGFTSVMFVASALSAPLVGRLVDRWGPRGLTLGIFALGALATLVLVTSVSYAWLLVAAAVAGFPMAIANPATNQLIRSAIPEGERGLMMGVKQSGVKVGQFLAGALLPLIATVVGWRVSAATLLVLGLTGFLMAAVLVPATPRGIGADLPPDGRAADLDLVRILALYGFFMGAGQAAVGAYVPLYAFEQVGMTVTAAGAAASVMGAVGIVARIGWSRRAERLRSVGRSLALISAVSGLSVLLLIAASGGRPWLVMAGAVLFGASAPVWNVIAMLAILQRVGAHATGRATSILFVGFSIGFIVGPLVFGATVDTTGSYAVGWLVVVASFTAAGVTTALMRRR